jgi:hypothetical protein
VARRRLLSDEAWGAVMALPSDERDLVRHYTLSSEDLDRLRGLRATHNQLGQALLLCAMRHPGRTLAPGERLPEEMIAWVALDASNYPLQGGRGGLGEADPGVSSRGLVQWRAVLGALGGVIAPGWGRDHRVQAACRVSSHRNRVKL